MRSNDFYEKYWQEDNAVPERDSTTVQRKRLLKTRLKPLVSNVEFVYSKTGSKKIKVLDAGCGNGEFSGFIKNMGCDVVAIDISQNALNKAKKKTPEIEFTTGSVEDLLSFKDGEFDVIWMSEVLEHVFDIHTCLSQVNRILNSGGQLILTVPYHGLIKNTVIALFWFELHFNPDISHIRFFTKRSLNKCLMRAGFKPIFWKGIGRFWPLYKSVFVVGQKTGLPEETRQIIG